MSLLYFSSLCNIKTYEEIELCTIQMRRSFGYGSMHKSAYVPQVQKDSSDVLEVLFYPTHGLAPHRQEEEKPFDLFAKN